MAVVAALGVGCGARSPAAAIRSAVDAPAIGVVDALTKVRPDFAVPAATTARIEAARNEVEPFQIVLGGGASGVRGVSAAAGDLVGPDGAVLPAANVRLYQVGLYHVTYASNVEGAPGEWPDPLIPDVDAYFGEKRNAFPFDVAAATTRAIWVELYVPRGTVAGVYSGTVTVSAAQGLAAPVAVAVSLRVRDFELPSTSSLKSAFGFSVDNACRAHHGESNCASNADAAPLVAAYGRAALDHRISFWNPYYTFPGNGDFSGFDVDSGPLLSGSAAVRFAGARMTTTALGTHTTSGMTSAKTHFDANGWPGLFDYTCDEPPATCAFSDILTRAASVHGAGVRTMVTTDLSRINDNGLVDAIDIVCPVIDSLQPAGSADNRASYDAFLARSKDKELWTYQSCDEHGCGNGCSAAQANDSTSGWPSYMIDASALQNRAMQWLAYKLGVSGELYYETAMHLDDAWNSHVSGHDALCDFGGNGDGALFYPGTPAQIGGTHDIAVGSLRLALIREGMEDYEYLHLLEQLGGGADAHAAVAALFVAAWQVTKATPAQLYATRSHLADLIEARVGGGPAPLSIPHADAAIDVHGEPAQFAAATPIVVAAGNAQATFRLLWNESALYVAADVSDTTLSAIGTGHDGELWNADGVELMIDPTHARPPTAGPDDRHVVVTAAGDLLEARGAGANEDRSVAMGSTFAVTTQGTVNSGAPAVGYRIVAAVPWSGIGVQPMAGALVGIDVALNDLDGTQLASNDWAAVRPFAHPILWNTVQLAAAEAGGGDPAGGVGGNAAGGGDGTGGNGSTVRAGCGVAPDDAASASGLVFVVLALLGISRRRR
jgi:MYXO-CTERM domain-containing protein